MFNRNLLIALAASSAVGLSLPTFAHNASAGVYIGGQLGWGEANHENHDRHHSEETVRQTERHHHNNHKTQDGFAGRAYLGYQFNQYVGLETGAAGISSDNGSHHHHHNDGNESGARDSDSHDDWKVKTWEWDLLARFGTPFGDSCFRGDVKVGAAAVFVSNNNHGHHGHHDNDDAKFGPAAGAGISYNFTQNVAMDVSYLSRFWQPQ